MLGPLAVTLVVDVSSLLCKEEEEVVVFVEDADINCS